ncbi:2Fe-2S iron-sulfur cluster-binding protein [Streptomyces sp. NPDC048521]|uniref:2Fe-2S iron-sulfur cluster-binding protein n=1 Tax=Streptomyces sp. NPDC048521 TaxID=3365566 RepID=UPI00371EF712
MSTANQSEVTLIINGTKKTVVVDHRVTLLDLLREHLGLTGTKKGCDHGQCGACTVLLNGQRINSCLKLAVSASGATITTIEGVADLTEGDDLHPLQEAFVANDAMQCGYCTPGQICSALGALAEADAGWPSHATADVTAGVESASALTPDEIRERMSGNLCRCGAHHGIIAAISQVAAAGSTR